MAISIPTPPGPFAEGSDTVEVDALTVAGALDELTRTHTELRKRLFTLQGRVRAFANLDLSDEGIRYLPQKKATRDRDALSTISSIADGCCGLSIAID
jgi:hypothetical protein